MILRNSDVQGTFKKDMTNAENTLPVFSSTYYIITTIWAFLPGLLCGRFPISW